MIRPFAARTATASSSGPEDYSLKQRYCERTVWKERPGLRLYCSTAFPSAMSFWGDPGHTRYKILASPVLSVLEAEVDLCVGQHAWLRPALGPPGASRLHWGRAESLGRLSGMGSWAEFPLRQWDLS